MMMILFLWIAGLTGFYCGYKQAQIKYRPIKGRVGEETDHE